MKQNKQTKLIVGYLSNTKNIVEVPMVWRDLKCEETKQTIVGNFTRVFNHGKV